MFSTDPLIRLAKGALHCRGCLGPLGPGSAAGLCAPCWEGLQPLPEPRCGRCALPHGDNAECPEPTDWSRGGALWDYHGGRPPLGALLLPGIKAGEQGWAKALLQRLASSELPEDLVRDLDLVTPVPTPALRRFLRGFDLADAAARLIAGKLGCPCRNTLRKSWWSGHQARRSESERRRLPRKAIQLRRNARLQGLRILLVDDVWTTGTTLLRCAQALHHAGATEVRVFTLFRALPF